MATVSELPLGERPAYRTRTNHAECSTAELLAAVLRTPDALAQAATILSMATETPDLRDLTAAALERAAGIGPALAASVIAAIELGRRVHQPATATPCAIRHPSDAIDILMPHFTPFYAQEAVLLGLLNVRNQLHKVEVLHLGGWTQAPLHISHALRRALLTVSPSIILAHNHPSGDPSPSPEDVAMTRELAAAGKLLDIELLDHLILCPSSGRWFSMRDRGLFPGD